MTSVSGLTWFGELSRRSAHLALFSLLWVLVWKRRDAQDEAGIFKWHKIQSHPDNSSHSPSSSSSSSAGLITTGGCVGLGTGSWPSVLMTPLSWGLAAVGRGAAGGGAGSSHNCSSFLFGSSKMTSSLLLWWLLLLLWWSLKISMCQSFYFFFLRNSLLTFIRWDEGAIYKTSLFMEKGTVWLLAAGWMILPIARYLLSLFLFEWE